MTFDWADLSFQERRAPGVATVFALAIFLVFLILAAQYESWGLPFSVLLGTPFAAFGAYLGLYLARAVHGPELRQQRLRANRADHAHRPGGEERDSHRRVREDGARPGQGPSSSRRCWRRSCASDPILMTAFAFILGVVPLLTASGAGAEGRKVMGMTVFCGHARRDHPGRLPDSDAVRRGREGDRRLQAAGAGAGGRAAGRWPRSMATRVTEMRRPALYVSRWSASPPSLLVAGCTVGPNYARPQMPTPRTTVSSTSGTAESIADAPWFAGLRRSRRCRRSSARRSPTTSICAPRSPESKRRAPAPASPSRSSTRNRRRAGYGVRQASSASEEEDRRRGHDASERDLRLPAVVGARSVRPHPPCRTKPRWPSSWRASRLAAA